MATRTRCILEALPQDVLELVLGEVRTEQSGDYPKLRLLCRAFKDLIDPQLFASLTIAFNRETKAVIGEKLAALASGTSPHVQWAKKLTIRELMPLVGWEEYGFQYDNFQGQEREEMLAVQNAYLLPALRAMKAVEDVHFYANEGRQIPTGDVMKALARLPSLRRLDVGGFNMSANDLEEFSNLEHLCISWSPSVPAWSGIKAAIKASPFLTSLTIYSQIKPGDERVKLGDLIGSLSKSSLRNISLRDNAVALSESCAEYLAELEALTVGDKAVVEPSFWKGLEKYGVQLKSLDMHRPDIHCARYISSYQSKLEVLRIANWPYENSSGKTPTAEESTADELFRRALPMHAGSLGVLSLGMGGIGPWCASGENLDGLLKCRELKTLDMMYYHPSPNEKKVMSVLPLDDLLSRIASELPRLQHLALRQVRKWQTGFGCGYAAGCYFDAVDRAFANTIVQTKFTVASGAGADRKTPKLCFTLRTSGTEFRLKVLEEKEEVTYGFEMVEDRWKDRESEIVDPDPYDWNHSRRRHAND